MRIKNVIVALIIAIGVTLFSVPAYANASTVTASDATSVNDSVQSKTPLTPKGNLTKVDDVHQTNETSEIEDKQFITVQSKNGNTFYIIIDRSGDEENVYFLNAVDEADLMSLMEDEQKEAVTATCSCTTKCETGSVNESCAVCAKDKNGCVAPAPSPTPTAATEKTTEHENKLMPLISLVVLMLLGGGGAAYWYVSKNRKSSTSGHTDVNELEEDEDEDYEFEDEVTETEYDKEPETEQETISEEESEEEREEDE